MKFTSPSLVSECIWNLRLADLPRGTNRKLINSLANGNPPYTEQERQENGIEFNCNFLNFTQLIADARRSYYNGFQAPGKYFSVTLDYGPPHSRIRWGNEITLALQRIMKRSRLYSECLDSQFASCTLHGIGPAYWIDRERWCPEEKGVEDVLIPGDTLRSLRNLDYFPVYCQYTPEQLYRLTHGPRPDPAWNMPMVESALEWAHNQTQSQLSYSDLFSPEKREERFKQDLGFYGTDSVPTIDFWKFFYHEDKKGAAGWRMRAVLDTPGAFEVGNKMPRQSKIGKTNGEWLYNPGDRVYASDIEQLMHFQFGDLSAVAPFHYRGIRSLGWLLYSISHLYNRLRCREMETTFENTKQYFRGNEGDRTRVMKIDLPNKGVVPDGVSFVRPEERWNVDHDLLDGSINRLRQDMEYTAAQYRQRQDSGVLQKEKTATEVMAEVNSSMAMVGSMLTQAYRYQQYQYREIARRFCIKNSADPEVREFRAYILRKRVPEKMLNVALWNIEPERVMGGGNKTLQLAMADSLLQMRPLLDPESQRVVDRIVLAARTDNDDLALRLVPEIKSVSNSAHDAALAFASMMLGTRVPHQTGVNHVDSVETLLASMAAVIQRIETTGAMAKPEELLGLQNVAQHINEHLQILAQDKNERQRVKQYAGELSQLTNLMKGYGQRLQEQAQQAAQQGNGGIDPKDAAKIEAMLMQAKVKAQNAETSHAARTAQKQLSWEKEEQRKEQQHSLDMRRQMQETQVDTAAKDLTTAAEIRRGNMEPPESTE